MADGIEKLLQDACAKEIVTLVVVGEETGSRALVRALASALERAHAIGFSRDVGGWAESGAFRLVKLDGELTAAMGVRSALRQDPDFLVVEASGGELPWEMLLMAAATGHGLLVRAASCPDERPVLEVLRGVEVHLSKLLPRILVADAKGVARIVESPEGDVIWRRGDPLPAFERALGRKPYVRPEPPPREPVPPLEPELFERLRAALAPHVRPVFVPVLADPSDEPGRSRLSGLALLAPGEEWPRCGECSQAMPLAFQLARSDAPDEVRASFPDRSEHLQFFYCSSSGCGPRDPSSPLAKNRLIRFIASGVPAAAVPSFEQGFAARDIAGWERLLETPATDDVPGLPEDLSEARWQLADRVQEGVASEDEAVLAGPRLGEKLLGWPHWTQGAEWEACPRCGERLAVLFQADANEGPLEMLFAADGTGHVSQCAQHKDVLAFRWACG